MRRSLRVAALSALLVPVLAGVTGRAQDQAQGDAASPPQQPPTFRTGINFVRVDAIVTDKSGSPIADLKPEDFVVTEQGRPQKVETFKLVSLDGGLIPGPEGPPRAIVSDLDEEREAQRDDVRLFAIFLDDYHVTRGSSLTARDQIARFVDTQLGPSDMIGLMYPLESTASVRMTRNHDAVMGAVRQFDGRKYDYRPKNSIEERYQYYPAETIEKIRNQVSLSALEGLIIHMGGLKEGRKALILVSEGFTGILPPQMRDPNASYPGLLNPATRDPQAGLNDLQESRAQAMAAFDMELELRQLTTVANRNNVSIYAVDPRGLAGSEFDIERTIGAQVDRQYLAATMESLRTLSSQTDGATVMNRNDLAIGMKQIVRDTSAYYLLGYNSTFTDADGKFHEIKVSVKRPGVQVRARKGYWAATRAEAAAAIAPPKPALPKPIENALAAAAVTSRARVIRSWIGTERGENGRTKVTFVWEPMARLPESRSPPRGPTATRTSADSSLRSRGLRGTVTPGIAWPSRFLQGGCSCACRSRARAPSFSIPRRGMWPCRI